MSPVKETPAPTEYQFNYWLLNRTYLFEDELDKLDPDGDSVQALYKVLDDPYTRYVPPSKSEAATQQMNTSIVEGDLGMEYMLAPDEEHPLFVYRVYPESPAAKAGVPRYGNIISINGREITDIADMAVYDSIEYNSAADVVTMAGLHGVALGEQLYRRDAELREVEQLAEPI